MRFDAAAHEAIRIADTWAQTHDEEVVVVRDLLGRNALALQGEPDPEEVESLRADLRKSCQPFVGGEPVLVLAHMFAPDLVTNSPHRQPAPFTLSPSGLVSVIERGTVGSEWLNPSDAPLARRVTLYGFKGGVGRSTATFALAQHIANKGKVVLVVDLDLESPGVSTMLSPNLDGLPEHGILDHLVEYGVGNAAGLNLVAKSEAVGDVQPTAKCGSVPQVGRPGKTLVTSIS
jgi:Mrp family chromosome partitioning ATPase